MATLSQISANRLNALKSTGPSPVALAKTRFNALKSGLDAKSLVIPGEDPAELEALTENYRQQFQPATPVEIALLDTLVTADWELRRLRKIEPKLWSEDAFLDPDSKEAKRLARFYRRLDTTERSYHRALKELNKYAMVEQALPPANPETATEAAANEKSASFLNRFCDPSTAATSQPSPDGKTGAETAVPTQPAPEKVSL
jgi:hypothetical protein